MTVRVLEERRFDPPRAVEVQQDGTWHPGWLRAWRRLDDGTGWRADVQYAVQHWWGVGTHVATVPASRVRPSTDAVPRAAHERLRAVPTDPETQ